jgi:hypothetical protein
MTIKPIKTERDHQKALKEIEKLSKVSGFALLISLPEGAWTGRIRKKAYVNTPLMATLNTRRSPLPSKT